jgi:hypothetical protein
MPAMGLKLGVLILWNGTSDDLLPTVLCILVEER